MSIEVRPVGDPKNQADPMLRSHMRDFLVEQRARWGESRPARCQATYAVAASSNLRSRAAGPTSR
jgi:hypothetical protein